MDRLMDLLVRWHSTRWSFPVEIGIFVLVLVVGLLLGSPAATLVGAVGLGVRLITALFMRAIDGLGREDQS